MNWPVMKLGVADYPPLAFRAISIWLGVPRPRSTTSSSIPFAGVEAVPSSGTASSTAPEPTSVNLAAWQVQPAYGVGSRFSEAA